MPLVFVKGTCHSSVYHTPDPGVSVDGRGLPRHTLDDPTVQGTHHLGVIAGQVQEGAMAQLDTVLFYGRGEAHVIEYCDEIAGATAPPTLTDAHGRSCRVVGELSLIHI